MRFKEDVREDAGENLADRLLVPLDQTTVDATPAEENVYRVLSDLRAALKSGQPRGGRNGRGLLQYGIYKQFLSSPESCRKTLRKRIDAVRDEADAPEELVCLERIQSALGELSIRDSSRYRLLRNQLATMGWDGSPASPRVLIFTEYRETQDALVEALARDFSLTYSSRFEDQPGQVLAAIHGSCPDVHLMKTIEAFGTGSSPMRMLVATDVASEGINLHHACHHIIHYDLPWSIITLIQRNGRIDRFGQTRKPVLRYLRVRTRQGLIEGDEEIFQRLINKVEEINHATRQGESVLKLYDPEAEERYIAEAGLLAGNKHVLEKAADNATAESIALENTLQAAMPQPDEDFLKFLMGDADAESPPGRAQAGSTEEQSRFRLYDDKRFLMEGYRYLAENGSNYPRLEETGKLLLLTAPEDLRRRLGAADDRGDVIFGSTAIPIESWPEHHLFRLTDDPDQVELAIQAARNTSGYWAKDLLCTDQHPILKWITERLLMLMKRGECPHITSKQLEPKELCFCFIGQVSSRSGAPLVVDAHAISYRPGGKYENRTLRDALAAADFERLVNDGSARKTDAAQALVPAAVQASLDHMRRLQAIREGELIPLLRAEERRLRRWRQKREELLVAKIRELGESHPRAKRFKRELEELEDFLRDREKNWRDTHFTAAPEPLTQLVLVIEGTT